MFGTMNTLAILLVCCILTLTLAKPSPRPPGEPSGSRPRYGKKTNDDRGMNMSQNHPLQERMQEICEKVQNNSAVNITLSPDLLQKCGITSTGKPSKMMKPNGFLRKHLHRQNGHLHPRKAREIEADDVPPSENPNTRNPPMGSQPTGEPLGEMPVSLPEGHMPHLSVTGPEDIGNKTELPGNEDDDDDDDDDDDSKEEVENEEDSMDDEDEDSSDEK